MPWEILQVMHFLYTNKTLQYDSPTWKYTLFFSAAIS